MRQQKPFVRHRVRNNRKSNLLRGFSPDSMNLENRELLAASLVADLNKTLDATLLFDNGKIQMYQQGLTIVTVSDGVKKEIVSNIEVNDKAYGFFKFFASGDSIIWGDSSMYIDKSFIYNCNNKTNKEIDISINSIKASGNNIISFSQNDFFQEKIMVFSNTSDTFFEVNSPSVGYYFESVFSLSTGRFLVTTRELEFFSSRSYILDGSSNDLQSLTIVVPDEPWKVKTIESQGFAFFIAGNNVFRTDGTVAGTSMVFDGDSNRFFDNDFDVAEYGKDVILSCSSRTNSRQRLTIINSDSSKPNEVIFDSLTSNIDLPDTAVEFELYSSKNSVLCSFRADIDLAYIIFVTPDRSVKLITKLSDPDYLKYAITSDERNGFFINQNDVLYHITDIGITKVSDGTVLGKGSYTRSSNECNVLAIDDKHLFFKRINQKIENKLITKLVATDTTLAGTVELALIQGRLLDLGYNERVDNFYAVTSSGLVFTNWDDAHGYEPWISDGTLSGTHILVDLVPGPASSDPKAFRANSNSFDFVAVGPDGKTNRFQYDTVNQKVIPELEMIAATQSSNPNTSDWSGRTYVHLGNQVVFRASDNLNDYLYLSDGTESGTRLIYKSSQNQISSFQVMDNSLFFLLTNNAYPPELSLWKSDGTSSGTSKITNLSGVEYVSRMKVCNDGLKNYLVLSEYDYYSDSDSIKAVSDGTSEGTVSLQSSTASSAITVINGNVIYTKSDFINSKDLLTSQSLKTGVKLNLGSFDTLNYLQDFNGKSCFQEYSTNRLLMTDGTVDGTTTLELPVSDYFRAVGSQDQLLLYPESDNPTWVVMASGTNTPKGFRINNYLSGGTIQLPQKNDGEYIYFQVMFDDGQGKHRELWRSNGTIAGTTRLVGPTDGVKDVTSFQVFRDGQTVIVTDSSSFIFQVMADGKLIKLNPGFSGSTSSYDSSNFYGNRTLLGVTNDSFLLSSKDPVKGEELFALPINGSDQFAIQPIANQSIEELSAWKYQVLLRNSPAKVIYSIASGNNGIAINPDTGLITWTPAETDGGTEQTVTITVQDAADASVKLQSTFLIKVLETNTAPVISTVPKQTLIPGQPWSYKIIATDSDQPIQSLVYSLVGSVPDGVLINSQTGLVSWTPTEAKAGANYPLVVNVTDNGSPAASSTTTVNISVLPVNHEPVISQISPQTVILGETLKLKVDAIDSDSGQILTYSLGDNPPSGSKIDTSGLLEFTPTATGVYLIELKVADNGVPVRSVSTQINVSVLPVNHAPVFGAVSKQTATVGQLFSMTVVATDVDAGQKLTYEILSGAPAGTKIDTATGVLSFVPSAVGSSSIIVQASDNGIPVKKSLLTVTIDVLPPPVQIGGVTVTMAGSQLSLLKIALGTMVDTKTANSVANYKVVKITTKKVGKKVMTTETNVSLKSAVFDSKTGLVTLTPTKKFALSGVYQLRIEGSKIFDNYGRAIDGDRNGTPGGLARYLLSKKGGTITSASF